MKLFKNPVYLGITGLSLLALVSLGTAGFLYFKNHPLTSNPVSPEPSVLGTSNPDTQKILARVGALIQLPTGESPTVATITDKTKLGPNPFFAPAENGDVVLIYTAARKAILYRPGINKIIDVAPITINTPTPPVGTAVVTPTPEIPTATPQASPSATSTP